MKHFNKQCGAAKKFFQTNYKPCLKHIQLIYNFHESLSANKSVRLELSEKKFAFTQRQRYNTKFYNPNKRK